MTPNDRRAELERRAERVLATPREPLTVHVDEHGPTKSVRWRLTMGHDAMAPTIYETHWVSGEVYQVNDMRGQIELACDVYLGRRHFDPEGEIRRLENERDLLREALHRYGQHAPSCEEPKTRSGRDCACGLNAAVVTSGQSERNRAVTALLNTRIHLAGIRAAGVAETDRLCRIAGLGSWSELVGRITAAIGDREPSPSHAAHMENGNCWRGAYPCTQGCPSVCDRCHEHDEVRAACSQCARCRLCGRSDEAEAPRG